MTREIEVALTEEFETTMAAQPEDRAVGDANGEPAIMDFTEVREGEGLRAAVAGAADVDAPLSAASFKVASADSVRPMVLSRPSTMNVGLDAPA